MGNFMELLKLLGEFDEGLRMHLESGRKNAMYTSKTVQSQVIAIIADMIREEVTTHIKGDNAFFSIIADEVTEKHSNREIMSLYLRFVARNNDKPVIKEVFFDLCYLTRTTGVTIAAAIKESLKTHGVDIQKARGQAFDGAAAMSLDKAGVAARIRDVAPMAVYTHCNSHILNLSIAASCKLPEIRNMIDTINSLFLFFNSSPKRQKFMELVLDVESAQTRKRHIKGLCKTRWVERHTCFETFQEV
ncbi:52 kDa repressor of the inhibitor of the protein kinase-like [Corticium candelabrum]|uniref:52 kDa repressor of the inhibitor of the protein kinase-like n=1 Tax=Corticium candelabrum TaxID=121492 RepID=UPI002E25A273|nr:52 kDa repressor of the inhibitor of the protein kinase-like [Corticium candelabrum]